VKPEIILATQTQHEGLAAMAVAFRDVLKRSSPSEADIQQSISMLLEQENREFFIARDEAGHSLGYIEQWYEYSMWLSGKEACLENLFVWPDYRRAGVASALTEYAIERAVVWECRSITLETNEMNTASVSLYGKLGFTSGSSRYEGERLLWFTKGV
jgi:ribosomal protein S18 acetylase RimI-like enzyme